MGEKKARGYIFRTYKACHRPYHVHIFKDGKLLGSFDIENQRPLTKNLVISKTGKLAKALRELGYLM